MKLEAAQVVVDCYYLRRSFERQEYGAIQEYIDYESFLVLAAKSFDDVEVWQQIDSQLNHAMTNAFLLDLQIGISRFVNDLIYTGLKDLLDHETLGFDYNFRQGDLCFFTPIRYE